jgi:hypothetical protein
MNGFVIFEDRDAAERFAKKLAVVDGRLLQGLTASRRQPLFIFRELPEHEVSRLRQLSAEDGGSIKESTQYAILRSE